MLKYEKVTLKYKTSEPHLEVDDPVGVLNDCTGVTGEEELYGNSL